MQSRWKDADARKAVETWARAGVAQDVALRTYTTRLLGRDPALVLHGGGNTSLKTRMTDLAGEMREVLCVKASGRDMAEIDPSGFAAVDLAPLRKLRALDNLSDADMARAQRAWLIDPLAPDPSVEFLLHAFMPHSYIDHTHANAVLALIDREGGAELAHEVYKGRLGLVPYRRPGFGLAKAAVTTFDADPTVEGLILDKHGIFTFGASAREAYERMIEMVSLAEARLRRGKPKAFKAAALPKTMASVSEVAPILRGAASLKDERIEGAWRRLVMEFRGGDAVLAFVNGREAARYARATPARDPGAFLAGVHAAYLLAAAARAVGAVAAVLFLSPGGARPGAADPQLPAEAA